MLGMKCNFDISLQYILGVDNVVVDVLLILRNEKFLELALDSDIKMILQTTFEDMQFSQRCTVY